jgi:hypothetical protein
MATRRKSEAAALAAAVAAAQAVAGAGDEALELGEQEEAALEAFEALHALAEGKTVRWRVSIQADAGTMEYVDTVGTEQLSPEYFKQAFGPGRFRVAGFDQHGKYIRGASKPINISKIGWTPPPKEQASAPAESALLRYMAEQRDREKATADSRNTLLAAVIPATITGAVTMLTAILTRKPDIDMGPVLAAAISNKGGGLQELIGGLSALKAMDGGGDKLDSAISILERLRELPLGEGAGGGGGWISQGLGLLREAVPAVLEAMKGRQAQGAAGAPAPRAVPVPPPAAASRPAIASAPPPSSALPPTAPSTQGTAPSSTLNGGAGLAGPAPGQAAGDDAVLMMVRPWLRERAEDCLKWAAASVDVSTACDLLMDLVPPVFRNALSDEQLTAWITRPDWWTQVLLFEPRLAPYQGWCEKLHEEILAALREEGGAPDGEPPGASAPADD